VKTDGTQSLPVLCENMIKNFLVWTTPNVNKHWT
jgi:hypothetical protein